MHNKKGFSQHQFVCGAFVQLQDRAPTQPHIPVLLRPFNIVAVAQACRPLGRLCFSTVTCSSRSYCLNTSRSLLCQRVLLMQRLVGIAFQTNERVLSSVGGRVGVCLLPDPHHCMGFKLRCVGEGCVFFLLHANVWVQRLIVG